jgi:hypothetical protein
MHDLEMPLRRVGTPIFSTMPPSSARCRENSGAGALAAFGEPGPIGRQNRDRLYITESATGRCWPPTSAFLDH